MADENKDLVDDVQAEKDFSEGFNNPTASTPPAPKPEDEKTDADKDKLAAAPEGSDTPKDPPDPVDPPPPPAPEYVQITKEQLASLESAAAKVGTFEAKIDKAFGSIGGIQQLVKDLQAKTPEGAVIEIPADAFADMEEEFPDIAKGMRTALEKTLKGARGTGTQATVDPEAVGKLVAEGIKQREMETLEDNYPDWKTIVGAVDSADKADPNNAFRKWLGTQPADYQKKINGTHSASVLARAIDKFSEATKAPPPKNDPPPKNPAPKDTSRRERISDAVQPKGDGHVPPPKPTADDEFLEGFKTG